jgi:hypothetical protein
MQLKHTEVPQWLSIERVLFDILRGNPEALRRSIFVSIEEALIIKGHGEKQHRSEEAVFTTSLLLVINLRIR